MNEIYKVLRKEINNNLNKKIVIFCVGSNEIIGDSLGPYVGEKLIKLNKNSKFIIKGNLKTPIHYMNIGNSLDIINNRYKKIYTIIVDSTLYTKSYIGNILILKKQIILGEALNKSKYKIGDICIKGIVGENYKNSFKNYKSLEVVSKILIDKMSDNIANQINKAINNICI